MEHCGTRTTWQWVSASRAMSNIRTIRESRRGGKDGFEIEWEMMGLTKAGAKFRATASTASRFPTTVSEVKVVGMRKFGDRDYNVIVFVPTEGILSAGIGNPLKWMQQQFDNRILQWMR